MFHRRRCIVSDMNALDLIVLGRQLTKIGEEVLRGSGDPAGQDAGGHGERPAQASGRPQQASGRPQQASGRPGQASGRPRQASFLPTGPSLVLRDVFAHPGSSITDITARTGLPQSYVSESVARLRSQGILETSADPADGRRTLVRVSAGHPRTVAAKGSAPVDGALAAALGEPDGGPAVAEIVATLSALAERLRPESPGPIQRQLDQARTEL
jgi:DNA-binding transcriptional ArsR family regulator